MKRCAVYTIEAFVRSTQKVTVAAAIVTVPHSTPNPLQLLESCAPRAPLTLWRLQDEEQKMQFLQSICTACDTAVQENKEQELRVFCRWNKLVENIMCFAKHFHSSESTDLILVALQGMRDCSNSHTQVAATMMDALMDNFKPTPDDVQRIVTAIHRWRKLITEKRPNRIIWGVLHWLAASDPHAVTLSLLRCSPTCDNDTWELWKMVLSSVDVVPKMVQEILQLLEMAPLNQETKIGSLPLAATITLHEIVQHEQYDPQVRLYFPELFVALIFQMVSSRKRKMMEVIAVMVDLFCPSTPTSAIRIVVEVLHNLLQCAGLGHLAHYMERHGLWGQLLGAATWRDGLRTLARLMVKNYRHQCTPIFSHVHMLLQNHQLHWREVPAMVFYMEMQSCWEFRTNFCPGNIFRKYIRSEHPQSQELALRGLCILNARSMHLLLPDVLTWLQDTRADVKLQALQLLHNIVAQHPGHLRDELSQLAVHLLSCFNEDNVEVRCLSMELFAQLLVLPGKRRLLPHLETSLLPLFFHMNEEIPRVAKVGAARGLVRSL
ncbi:hypothetical protein ASZ78_000079, partial [Callipepla squamata]